MSALELRELEAQESAGGAEQSGGSDEERLLADAPRAASPPSGPRGALDWLASVVTTERAVTASWVVNWLLFLAKTVAYVESNSKSVLASLADSAVDLASQGMLSLAERNMKRHDARYPVGRARLEALAVLACACIMSMAAVEVVQASSIDLVAGLRGHKPELNVGAGMFSILGVGIGFKAVLWVLCRAAAAKQASDSMEALAEDHLNDVWSNSGAVVTGIIAGRWASAWWVDPAGGIAISVVIIIRWLHLTHDQMKKMTGHTAPPEFIERVNALAAAHSTQLALDCTRAYHFGSRFNVEARARWRRMRCGVRFLTSDPRAAAFRVLRRWRLCCLET